VHLGHVGKKIEKRAGKIQSRATGSLMNTGQHSLGLNSFSHNIFLPFLLFSDLLAPLIWCFMVLLEILKNTLQKPENIYFYLLTSGFVFVFTENDFQENFYKI